MKHIELQQFDDPSEEIIAGGDGDDYLHHENQHDFISTTSWSQHPINGELVIPVDLTTVEGDDLITLPTTRFSKTYIPFWIACSAYFTMFVAYNVSQNMALSLHGTNGSIALAVLYVCFIIGNFITPAFLTGLFRQNVSLMICCGSVAYTVFMLANIPATLGTLIAGAAFVGLCAGFVWVGYASLLTALARYITEQDYIQYIRVKIYEHLVSTSPDGVVEMDRIDDIMKPAILPNGRVNASALSDNQLKIIMKSSAEVLSWLNSIGWAVLNLNTVCGGFIALIVLGNDDDGGADANNTDAPTKKSGRITILFIVFVFVALLANVFYYIMYRWTPSSVFASSSSPLIIDKTKPPLKRTQSVNTLQRVLSPVYQSQYNDTTSTDTIMHIPHADDGSYDHTLDHDPTPTPTPTTTSITTKTPDHENADDTHDIEINLQRHHHHNTMNHNTNNNRNNNNNPFQPITNSTSTLSSLSTTSAQPRTFLSSTPTPSHQQTRSPPQSVMMTPSTRPIAASPVKHVVIANEATVVMIHDDSFSNDSFSAPMWETSHPQTGYYTQSQSPQHQKSSQHPHHHHHYHHHNNHNNHHHASNSQSGAKPHGTQTKSYTKLGSSPIAKVPVNYGDDSLSSGSGNDTDSASIDSYEYGYPSEHHSHTNLSLNDSTRPDTNSNATTTTTTNTPEKQGENTNSILALYKSFYLMKRLVPSRFILLSLITYIHTSIPTNFVFAVFTANSVKPVLGTSAVSIIIIMVALCNVIGALVGSRVMKTFNHTRLFTIAGTLVQISYFIFMISYPYRLWSSKTVAWVVSSIIACLAGASDSFTQSGVNSSLGMAVGDNPYIRTSAFGLCQTFKSIGSIILFMGASGVSYLTLTWVTISILILSLISQVVNFYAYLPIDADYVMGEYHSLTLSFTSSKTDCNSDVSLPPSGSELESLGALSGHQPPAAVYDTHSSQFAEPAGEQVPIPLTPHHHRSPSRDHVNDVYLDIHRSPTHTGHSSTPGPVLGGEHKHSRYEGPISLSPTTSTSHSPYHLHYHPHDPHSSSQPTTGAHGIHTPTCSNGVGDRDAMIPQGTNVIMA